MIAPSPDHRSHSYGEVIPPSYMDREAVWESEDGVFLRVLVRPKSTLKNLISEVNESLVVVNLKSPAREGKANSELLKRLAKILDVSTSDLRLVAGQKSREKTILISSKSIQDVKHTLAKVADSV